MRQFLGIHRTLLLGAGLFCSATAWGGEQTSRVLTYEDQGKTHFAMSLASTSLNEVARSSMRVAIVVDTSASQNGTYRLDSIEIAKRVLGGLPSGCVASLIVCDIDATVLGVGAPGGSEIREAIASLEKTVPLGTTDLLNAIKVARKSLGDANDASIVYIGDGIHRRNLVDQSGYQSLVNSLRESRTTVSSLAIGPVTDVEQLATLANHTGGFVYVHSEIENVSNQQIAENMAKASVAPVFWPEGATMPTGIEVAYPANVPPLRGDRDSIVLGKLTSANNLGNKLELKGTISGRPATLSWNLASAEPSEDLAYLPELVRKSDSNQGLFLPTAGSLALQAVGVSLMNNSEELVKDARFALHIGNREAAIAIAKQAVEQSPNSLSARNMLDAALEMKDGNVSSGASTSVKTNAVVPAGGTSSVSPNTKSGKANVIKFISYQEESDPFGEAPAADLDEVDPFADDLQPADLDEVVAPPATTPAVSPAVIPSQRSPLSPAPAGSMLEPSLGSSDPSYDELANAGDLLQVDEQLRQVAAQQLETQVRAEVNAARRATLPNASGTDYGALKLSLKSLLDQVRRAPELDVGSRVRLERLVADAVQRAARAETAKREEFAREQAVRASHSATQRLIAESERREATIKQLVDRYESLMRQQLFTEANTDVAPQITEIARGSVIDAVTNLESNIAANARLIEDVINQRNKAFVDSLFLNESNLIPFVDEPPIRYPPHDVWQALSARRLERYGSIDLSGGNEVERQIFRSLSKEVSVEFNGEALSQVLNRYGEELQIPIMIDFRALDEEGVAADEAITLELASQVSFRSALKLILEPLNLTYVIEDEVMRITTKNNSANVIRVYPVGDLAIPVIGPSGGGGMGGMGMGGMGMGGMGMGGMGMGGMGMGGMGGMGMGGMGMGGMGFQAVEDAPRKAAPATETKSVEQLLVEVASDDEVVKLQAENELAKWVSTQMVAGKKAIEAGKEDEATKHFDKIVEVVQEAMRRTLPAAWMYDALSTSMQANNYPARDLMRVLLSSVDYGGDDQAAVRIAKYLYDIEKPREAVELLRDVHTFNAANKEALELALKIAVELEDTEHMQWASTGVLSQAWSDNDMPLIEKAILTARTCYIRLANNKETMRAKIFEKELRDARVRDLIVRVVWTGDADLDIAIEEPTGTVCDVTNPRTSSGGLHLGDGSSLEKSSKDGFSETYVCTQGYAGAYKIMIKKVWGEVAGGKVTVNILSDFDTPDQKVIQQVIDISDDKPAAVVIAHVKNGHRTEPIAESYLAAVRRSRGEIGSAILAQQATEVKSTASSAKTSEDEWKNFWDRYASSIYNSNNNLGNVPYLARTPFYRGGAVGYRPNITTIPQGTMMQPQAVISGDRRYVRISFAMPIFFTDIIAVDTFNMASGSSGTSPGAGVGGNTGGIGGGNFGGGNFGGGAF